MDTTSEDPHSLFVPIMTVFVPMKTASLGLLEVRVVRVNAGGDAPPDPPSVGDVTGHSPFLCFLTESFLAN